MSAMLIWSCSAVRAAPPLKIYILNDSILQMHYCAPSSNARPGDPRPKSPALRVGWHAGTAVQQHGICWCFANPCSVHTLNLACLLSAAWSILRIACTALPDCYQIRLVLSAAWPSLRTACTARPNAGVAGCQGYIKTYSFASWLYVHRPIM